MSTYHKSTTNYSNRTVDLLLLQLVEEPKADAIVHPDVSNQPHMTTGIEKLVQRFTLLFLTQVGTIKNCEDEGTEFLSALGSGNIYDINTLRAAASAANKAVFTQIRNEDIDLDTPDDELLESSVISDLELDRSKATVYVTITLTTAAGEKYTYTTPVTTGV